MRSRVITERHVGTVTENADPEFRGRLRVRCDTLLATGQEFPFWIEPSPIALAGQADGTTDAGVWYLPTAGTPVLLHVTVGHELDEVPGETAIAGPEVRWSPAALTDFDSFPSILLTNYPERRGWTTPRGSAWFFDDTEGAEVFAAYVGSLDIANDIGGALAMGRIGAVPEFGDFGGPDFEGLFAGAPGAGGGLNGMALGTGFEGHEGIAALVDDRGYALGVGNAGGTPNELLGGWIKVEDGVRDRIMVIGEVPAWPFDGIVLTDLATGETFAMESGGNIHLFGSANLHLNDQAETAQGVARINDTVGPDTGMSTWITQVAAVCNSLVPGSVTPAFPTDFGVITGGSATVKAGG